jgi:hypothetical protein
VVPVSRRDFKGLWTSGRLWLRVILPLSLVALYLGSPYLSLWRLDHALTAAQPRQLEALVDLEAIRGELARKLDKGQQSRIGPLSDQFIEWLEQGIRRDGVAALERQVTLDWVRGRLLAHSPPGAGLWPALAGVHFDSPVHVSARLQGGGGPAVIAGLSFNGLGWRVTSIYD